MLVGLETNLLNEPVPFEEEPLPNPWMAILPLALVGELNKVFTTLIPQIDGKPVTVPLPGHPVTVEIPSIVAIWTVEGAVIVSVLSVVAFDYKRVMVRFAENRNPASAGALLASMNKASEYGFSGIIAALPGFSTAVDDLKVIPSPW